MRRVRGKASRLTMAGFPRTVSPTKVFGPKANDRHRPVPVPASPGPARWYWSPNQDRFRRLKRLHPILPLSSSYDD